jgi:hypothetical protein
MLKILLLVLTLSQSKEVTERGGLIFEYEGNAQINQDFVQYSRLVDTTALFKVAQTLADSSTLYSAYCEVIDEVTSPSQDNEIDNQLIINSCNCYNLFCYLRMFIHVSLLLLSKIFLIMSLYRKNQPNHSSHRFHSGPSNLHR